MTRAIGTADKIELVPVSEVSEGDWLDLEGDKYADPKGDRIEFETEYVTVAAVRRETAHSTALMIEGVDLFGFPPDHKVKRVTYVTLIGG